MSEKVLNKNGLITLWDIVNNKFIDMSELTASLQVLQVIDNSGNRNVYTKDETAGLIGQLERAATETQLGMVKSSKLTNQISVNSNGTMEVNNIGINKLTNVEGEDFILNCNY